ncbi:hypothetical protein [Bacillus sp. MYb209]|uniref:hypothetical protein n=1 Tax=Bacillus sp. MYb209 TaxID=1848605 RepID=UPI00115B8EB5|nr:hypothetical protein [Bacillus sp. MYb209]
MGEQLPVKVRLVWANNQWGWKRSLLIKVSLYKKVDSGIQICCQKDTPFSEKCKQINALHFGMVFAMKRV